MTLCAPPGLKQWVALLNCTFRWACDNPIALELLSLSAFILFLLLLLLLLLWANLDDIVNGMDDSVACEDVVVGQPGSRSHFICIRNNLATNWLQDKITNTAKRKKDEIGMEHIANLLMAQKGNWQKLKHHWKSCMSWFVADLASAILNTITEISSSTTRRATAKACQQHIEYVYCGC